MSNLKLTVNIDNSVFPELGLPTDPIQAKDLQLPTKMRGKSREDYDNYYQAQERVGSYVADYLRNTSGQSYSRGDNISFSFDYEPKIPHTYKFLGMDIDDDYRAVIPVGDGCIIVGNLYDAGGLVSINKLEDDYRDLSERFSPEDVRDANSIIKKSSSEIARRLSTAMKSGALFSCYKKASDSMTDYVKVAELLPLVDVVKSYAEGGTEVSLLDFKSILLNLIHEAKNKIDNMIHDGSVGTSSVIIIIKCFMYWKDVLRKYNKVYSTLASVDLWQAENKKVLGEDDFNRRVASNLTFKVHDPITHEVQPGIPSISGVARNWDVLDSNINRDSSSQALGNLTKAISGRSEADLNDINDLMIGCIDTDNFENPYDLSPEELQAVSNYDSLQYIDEDASLCVESYNMEDPDERALFIKSAIKSYERNFKEYKPKANYDVTEAMSDLIERGERFKSRIIDDESSNEEDTSTYIVTSTNKEIKLNFDKRNLLKVSKLIGKQITSIDKQFL